MRDDKDLNFLANVPSEKLDPLVQIITQKKNGKSRFSESLTSHSLFIEHSPDHHQYWHNIADELQRFGANSIATAIRGKGVLYHEIVKDVAEKLEIEVSKSDSVADIEQNILIQIVTKSLAELSPQDLKDLTDELELETTDFTAQAVSIALGLAVKRRGFIAYKVAAIVASAVSKQLLGQGLKFGANMGISRTLGFILGPIGWTVTGAWTAADIAGPAYRVTIPAVIQIALLRAQQGQEDKLV